MRTYLTSSSAGTKKLGYKIAGKISNPRSRISNLKGATVVGLSGELGSGKTTFVQGFLHGLGVKKRSASPTFIIFRRFKIRGLRFKNVFHADAYRIKMARELGPLGLRDIFKDSENVVIVEWSENIRTIMPKDALRLRFHHGGKENERRIIINR